MANHNVNQIVNTGACLAGNEADWNDVAFTKCLSQWTVKSRRICIAFFQIFFHGFIIYFNNLFDELTVYFSNAEEIRFAVIFSKAVDNACSVVCREVNRHNFITEGFLQFFDEFRKIDVFCINFVDDKDSVEIAFFCPVHHSACHELDAGCGVNNNGCRFDSIERAESLPDEIRVSRGINHMNADFRPIFFIGFEVCAGCSQGVLNGFFKWVRIAYCRSSFDRAACNDHSALGKNAFCQRGFA